MRSDRERTRDFYPYQYQDSRGKAVSRKKKHSGVSLWFCWGFSVIVAAVFGIASFLMFSAGHFDISPDTYEGAAWGGNDGEENFISTKSLVQVEVTELDVPSEVPDPEELYAEARNNMMEEFGPFPKYLSNYESIILSVTEDGTDLPANEDEEEDIIEVKTAQAAPEVPVLTEQGPFWVKHVVKGGETLSDIAKDYGNITAQDILRANGLKDANRLSENQLLLIPNDPSKVEETLEEVRIRQIRVAAIQEDGKVEPITTKNYVVTQGDSLWSIANSQNIELDTLVGSNSFKTSARLRPGVILRIPNQDGIFYVMKKGEDIEAVSKRYGVSMNKIRQVNVTQNIDALRAGDEIFLPDAKPESVIEHKDVKLAEVKKSSSQAKPAKTAPKTAAKVEKPKNGEVAVRRAKGGFRWPVMGRINSPFGWRQHPITRRKDFHTGIDIKADRNDPIKAAGSGKIVYSGWMGGYGKVLVIEHPNGQSTLYAHCSTLSVGKGASVSSGQLVARVGTTGRSTGPHLHFEVRNGNSPVNPIKYLSR